MYLTVFLIRIVVFSTHSSLLHSFSVNSQLGTVWSKSVRVTKVLSSHGWTLSKAFCFTATGGDAAVQELPKAVIPNLADLASSLA